jgi:glycosyltransferase involved in cell wall biosynthesis
VTTAHNEAGNVGPFLSEVLGAVTELGVRAEVVYIDDGSTDGTGAAVLAFAREHPELPVRLIRHGSKRGISAAIVELSALARGELVFILPADLESSPASDIPALYNALDDQTDLVAGCRKNRGDGKVFTSRVGSRVMGRLFGVHLRDPNWIKLVRREKLRGLRLRSEWHRFLVPILVHRGARVKEVLTQWHPRRYGRSKFGFKRLPVALADVLALKLILKYGQRPLLPCGLAAGFALALAALLAGLSFVVDGPRAWVLLQVLAGALVAGSFVACVAGAVAEMLLPPAGPPEEDGEVSG